MMARQTVYLRLKPSWRNAVGQVYFDGFHVESVTKNPPRRSLAGVVLKLTLVVPDAAFIPLRPEAVIEVGMSDLTVQVEVEPAPPDPEPESEPHEEER